MLEGRDRTGMYEAVDKLRAKAADVHRRLLDRYGEPRQISDLDPVSQLVSTILSQNTNDTNRDVAFRRLTSQFPSWEQVLGADPDAVVEAIRPAGLANQKGPRIQAALRFIARERGELDLGFLASLSPPEAKAWLQSMNGVGPKTAAIVLLFSLGRPAFPVDTHVYRVSKRLGLIGSTRSREQAHGEMERLVEQGAYYSFHLNLIRHGRAVCISRSPRCPECVLKDLCDYYQARTGPPSSPAAVESVSKAV